MKASQKLIVIVFIAIFFLVFFSLENVKSRSENIGNDNISSKNENIINTEANNKYINNSEDVQIEGQQKIELSEEKAKNKPIDNLILDMAIHMIEKETNIEDMIALRERVELHSKLWTDIFGSGPYTVKDFKKAEFVTKDPQNLTGEQKLLAVLHQNLYPWLYRSRYFSPEALMQSFNGRGIIISIGNYHFKFAHSTIDTLRNVLHCKLPIEIFYNGEDDLDRGKRKILSKYSNVTLSDISTYFDNKPLQFAGWDIKPFAILASKFKEVICIDADSMYIRDPSILFEDPGYKSTGTIFFKDRTLFPGSHRGSIWLKSWMVDPLPETKLLRYWKEKTSHEMESSTVVIDKSKALIGLLSVCKLNEKKRREEVVYKNVHGDKETFWIGFDMARQHYYELRRPAAIVGELTVGEGGDNPEEKQLCGHVGHLTYDGQLLYWNDHIVRNKNDEIDQDRLLQVEAYLADDKESTWFKFFCMNLEGRKATTLSDEDKAIYTAIIDQEKKKHYLVSGKYDNETKEERRKQKIDQKKKEKEKERKEEEERKKKEEEEKKKKEEEERKKKEEEEERKRIEEEQRKEEEERKKEEEEREKKEEEDEERKEEEEEKERKKMEEYEGYEEKKRRI